MVKVLGYPEYSRPPTGFEVYAPKDPKGRTKSQLIQDLSPHAREIDKGIVPDRASAIQEVQNSQNKFLAEAIKSGQIEGFNQINSAV